MRRIISENAAAMALVVGLMQLSSAPAFADDVIADDLIVQGKTCIGVPCVNGESFGTGTLRLKDTETRIDFIDTNTLPFAPRDWRIEANSIASGGAQYLAIKDMGDSSTGAEGGTALFTATAGAPANSIFIDSTGRVGFRTGSPQLGLHMLTGNTPALRFEQDTSGGQTAQTWDVGGNEAGFFFARDVTAGGTFPFRIRPGAPTSSLDIAASGNVGIGTTAPAGKLSVTNAGTDPSFLVEDAASPDPTPFIITNTGAVGIGTTSPTALLHMLQTSGAAAGITVDRGSSTGTGLYVTSTGNHQSAIFERGGLSSLSVGHGGGDIQLDFKNIGANDWAIGLDDSDADSFKFSASATVGTSDVLTLETGGSVGIGTSSPAAQLHTTGTVRFAGVPSCGSGIKSDASGNLSCITSSRRFKAIAGKLSPDVALANVMALQPQIGAYKETPEVPEHWLIAEDVAAVDPALAGFRDGEAYTVKTQNVVADLVAVIQQQQRLLQEQERRIEALEQR